MDFVTLGMLIIDEIHHPQPTPPSYDVLGGAGTYAALGARLFMPQNSSHNVGWVVHRGYDFPRAVSDQIQSWATGVRWVDTPNRKTTRGWNGYVEGGDVRAFKFTTEKKRVDETQLTDEMLLAKAFHMICMPARCISLVEGITQKRKRVCSKRAIESCPDPIFVWEPFEDSCTPDALSDVLRAMRCVNVFSPNHSELAALFVEVKDALEPEGMDERCMLLLDKGFEEKPGAIVVRCSGQGCYIRSKTERRMLPAFHQGEERRANVVDPTGAGNTFLGAFCLGLSQGSKKDFTALENGAIFGSIAASFAIEQIGLPALSFRKDGNEAWNGDTVIERTTRYTDQLSKNGNIQ